MYSAYHIINGILSTFRESSNDIRLQMEEIGTSVKNIDVTVSDNAKGVSASAEAVSAIALSMTELNEESANNASITEHIKGDMDKFLYSLNFLLTYFFIHIPRYHKSAAWKLPIRDTGR